MIKFLMLLSLMYSGAEFARVGDLRGDAKIWRYGEEGSEWLTINNIIGEGDELLTNEDSYLEIEFSDGSVLTLGGNTSIYVDRVEEDRTYFTLNRGVVRVYARERVFGIFAGDRAVYVEEGSIVRVEKGEDYFLARVYKGVSEVDKKRIYAGSEIIVERGRYYSGRVSGYDRFDRWAEEREKSYYVISRVEYIPVRCYIGIYHLREYGRWVYVRPYGWVWVPRVPRTWRPYSHGHWVYRPGLGWVWVSYEPWGWIPYRYGTWTYVVGYGWIWIPGETFAGAWVEWYYGPDWVGWAPIDYYGRPVIVVNNITVVNIVTKEDFHKPVYRYKPPKGGVYKEVYKPYKGVNVKEVVKHKVLELEKPVYFKQVDVRKEYEKPTTGERNKLTVDKNLEGKIRESKEDKLYPERPVIERRQDKSLERDEQIEKREKNEREKINGPDYKDKTLSKDLSSDVLLEKPVQKTMEKETEPRIYPERPSYRDFKSRLLEREEDEKSGRQEPTLKKGGFSGEKDFKIKEYSTPAIEKQAFDKEVPDKKKPSKFEKYEKVQIKEETKGASIFPVPKTETSKPSDKILQNKHEVKRKVEKKLEQDDNNKDTRGESEK